MKPKLCIDCKWYVKNYQCARWYKDEIDLVTGQLKRDIYILKDPDREWGLFNCGRQGRYFEPKERKTKG